MTSQYFFANQYFNQSERRIKYLPHKQTRAELPNQKPENPLVFWKPQQIFIIFNNNYYVKVMYM